MAGPGYFGSYVPTTSIYDVAHQIQNAPVDSPEFRELILRLYQNLNLMATVLNTKDTGLYVVQELINSQQWYPNPAYNSTTQIAPAPRQVFRKVIVFGALPNSTFKTVAHGIVVGINTQWTRIYAAASKPSAPYSGIPIPYASTAADNIEISVDDTYVTITTQSDRRDYTKCDVVLEYIQN